MQAERSKKVHPQTKRHLLNRKRLEAAAIKEFSRYGLQGAKVSNIVAAASLTQPSFYRTWTSKEAAYEEIIRKTRQSWLIAASSVLDGPDNLPLKKRIYLGIKRLFQALTSDLELTRLVLYEFQRVEDRYEPFIEIYTDVIQKAQKIGWVSGSLPAETLGQAYTALTRRFFMARMYTGQLSVDSAAKELTELIYPLFREEEMK